MAYPTGCVKVQGGVGQGSDPLTGFVGSGWVTKLSVLSESGWVGSSVNKNSVNNLAIAPYVEGIYRPKYYTVTLMMMMMTMNLG